MALRIVLVSALACAVAHAEPLDAKWNEGSTDCARHPGPPLQVHEYSPRTFILREGLCATPEAPFMYLLIGTQKALMIDTGDVQDASKVPLARTVQQLLARAGAGSLPLLVVHTHRHRDHRAGDEQLRHLPNTQVVGFDLQSVEDFYDLPAWPYGKSRIDLGERAIDVIPTPGHSETEITFYDRSTGLVFSGDFLLPGRILVQDIQAYRESAARLTEQLSNWPVTAFLGGHIEMNAQGKLFPWGATYHPHERPLPMTFADLKRLTAALGQFNGFYTESGGFTMMNSLRILKYIALAAGLVLIGVVWGVVYHIRRRRGHGMAQAAS